MSDNLKIIFYIHDDSDGGDDEELEIDSFEINISKNDKFGNLIEKITEERFVERGVITLMFKNEILFFNGSPENPDFKNMFEDSGIIDEIFELEKAEDGIIELIYKEKEAASGAFITTRKISSSKDVKIVVPLPTNKLEGAIQLNGGVDPVELYLRRKRMFQSTLLLKVVTHEEEINDKKIYQYKQFEIKSHDSTGWQHRPNAPIFIDVLDNNEIVVKVDGKPVTKTPMVCKIVEATEMEKDYYEKYCRKFLDVCSVVGTVAAILSIPTIIAAA